MRSEQLRAGRDVIVDGARIAARRLIPEFYEHRGFRPAWTRREQATALLASIGASRGHGLDPADYHAAALRRLLADTTTGAHALSDADRELLLTDALIRLAYHLHFGKADPRELYSGWTFTRSLGAIDPVQALEETLAAPRLDEAVERFAPQLPAYRHLQQALARLRAIEAAGGWPQLRTGHALKPGMLDPCVKALRDRLVASGDLAPAAGTEAARFDAALEAAVRRFQGRHGLDADGVVARRTIEALNVGVTRRIEQIRANLERLRWVAQDLAGDYLIVDIAGFSARLFRDGRLAWSSRTVVGRPYRKTPVFRATMQYIVLNPTWTVPPTILNEDVLPKLARDPAYLARNHMQVIDAEGRPVEAARLDWSRVRPGGFPHQIVQAPGSDNPLGRMKFMLPNPHAVYLHDTPARRLFEKPGRAFSSGCIRLERPLELAVLLLDDPEHWNAQAIRSAIDTGVTRTLPVKRHVPVLVLYFTAEAEADGSVHFNPDLYGRDARVLAALAAPFRFTPVDGRGSRRQVPAGAR
ncbi:MAG: L,D-transpeptidase family protein [Betaproteobacteria bacterium]|nr:L,D-transpeptidase family protein [Betaproteobacteria bacterium]